MLDETTVWKNETGKVPVRFIAGIGIETRVSNPAGDEWEATDTIGIYMVKAGLALADSAIREEAKNRPYTVSSGVGSNTASFETAGDTIYYPNGEDVNFIAYYPYSPHGGTVSTDYKYTMDISDQGNPSRLDLLYSNDKAVYNSKNHDADLTFEHLMTRVVFDALRTGTSNASLAGLQLEVQNVNTLTTFDLADGTPALDGAGTSSIIPFNRYASDDSVRMEATLIPMADASGVHLSFLLNNKSYSAPLPPAGGSTALLKGKRYTYKVLFDEAQITLEGHLSAWDEEPGDTITPNPDPGQPAAIVQIEGYSGPVTVLYASGDQETITIDVSGKADISSTQSGEMIESLTLGASGTPILIGCKAENAQLISLKVDASGSPQLRDEVDGYIPIGSYAEFKMIGESANLGNKYKQENDIDLLSENWTPIGSETLPFTGEYDGGEYKITNLKIDLTTNNVGLFGITNSATLRNIRLVSGTVNGGRNVGGICGNATGSTSITNAHSGAAITGTNSYIGGICGYVAGTTTITSCRNTGNVKGSYVGGIAGYLNGTSNKIKDCDNRGDLEGSEIGGVIGMIQTSSATEIITCRNSGTVISTATNHIAGIVGGAISATVSITASYNTGNVIDTKNCFSGGIVGRFSGTTLIACYNMGLVIGNATYTGLICGRNDGGPLTSSYWTKGSSTVTRGVAIGTDNTNEFSATAWPAAAEQGWGTGDGSEPNTYWKSLGGWNDGTPEYPTLWWE
jgi:hypothetical protein